MIAILFTLATFQIQEIETPLGPVDASQACPVGSELLEKALLGAATQVEPERDDLFFDWESHLLHCDQCTKAHVDTQPTKKSAKPDDDQTYSGRIRDAIRERIRRRRNFEPDEPDGKPPRRRRRLFDPNRPRLFDGRIARNFGVFVCWFAVFVIIIFIVVKRFTGK